MRYIIIILAILGLDQFTKWLTVSYLAVGESIPVIGIFKITYVQNTGAAFSILSGGTALLIIMTIVVLVVVAYCWRKPFMEPYRLTAAIIIGGTLGNFADRLFRGYVVDFFNFTYFPVFNVADIALCCGVGLFILQMFLDKDNREHEETTEDKN